jgi:dipeptidyl aminopeptidase/acylaminoacyl peptidase
MSPRRVEPEDLLAIRLTSDVQFSPDGSRIAYTQTEIDRGRDVYVSRIWVVPSAGGPPAPFTSVLDRDSDARWSPDGRWLAFLSARGEDPPQLYLMPSGGGEARRLTNLDGGAGTPVWSPDGTRIVFAARVSKETPPSDPAARARWTQRPKVITRAQYKIDGSGFTFDTRSTLVVVAATGGESKAIAAGAAGEAIGDDIGPAWSPDGRRIVFSRMRTGAADFYVSDLWVVDADGAQTDGGRPRRITEHVGRATSPAWSPDGATIACYGTDEQEHGYGESVTRVWTVPAAGGAPRRLTESYDRGVMLARWPAVSPPPVWSRDGRAIVFPAATEGNVHVVAADSGSGAVRTIVTGARQVTSVSVHVATERVAFSTADLDSPSDVYVCAGDGSAETRLTRANADFSSGLAWPRVERRSFRTPHGGAVEGWVFLPTTAARPAPLLLDIHGGPHSFMGNAFSPTYFYRYPLASRGWVILALNPTGSGSYGKAFAHGIRGRWGEYDMPEQMAAIDALIAEGIADGARLAIAGTSYGGFMSSWMITHTDRFKAAAINAPVANLESFYGTSDVGLWFGPFEMFGPVVASRETYRRLSPINYVDRVTTPTLVMHGEADDRCPIGQGEELYAGLVAAGRVPVEFVRYPGGAHGFVLNGRPSHRVDFTRRVTEWVERYANSPR